MSSSISNNNSAPINTFHASYTKKMPAPTNTQRVIAAMGYVTQVLIGKLIIPAQNLRVNSKWTNLGRSTLLSKHNGTETTLITPDGVRLNSMYIPAKTNSPIETEKSLNEKTIIYFGGNGELYEFYGLSIDEEFPGLKKPLQRPLSNLEDFTSRGYNVLLFNYRGVGRSQSHVTRKGLSLDAETVYQFVHKNLKVAKENIILLGHSVGGPLATEVAANHKRTNLCDDRPFSKLSAEIWAIFRPISSIVATALTKTISLTGWEMDSVKQWDKVKGKKCVVYHPQDQVIPRSASLDTALMETSNFPNPDNYRVINLKSQQSVVEHYQEKIKRELPEGATLDNDLIKSHISKIDNPHNRPFLPSEITEIFDTFKT